MALPHVSQAGYNLQLRPLQPVPMPMLSATPAAPTNGRHFATAYSGVPMADLTPQQISTAAHLQHSPSSTLSNHSTGIEAAGGGMLAAHHLHAQARHYHDKGIPERSGEMSQGESSAR